MAVSAQAPKIFAGLVSMLVTMGALWLFGPGMVLPVLAAACVLGAAAVVFTVWIRGRRWQEGQIFDLAALIATAVLASFLAVVW